MLMDKKVKFSYISAFALCALSVAWKTIGSYFGGYGLNTVAVLVVLGCIAGFVLIDGKIIHKLLDVYVLVGVLALLELVFCFFIGLNLAKTYEVLKFFLGYQNVLSCFAVLIGGYVLFRLVYEVKGWKIAFVETLLFNREKKVETSVKQPKEKQKKEKFDNALEEKPSKKAQADEVVVLDGQESIDNIVVSEEE